jgi:deazaflavin-dependent oxidoreductase (nitroreductase family)
VDRDEVAALDFCYVTTKGRRSGHPHTIEIWFALRDDTVYVLSGGGDGSDWVRNLREDPTVGLRLGDHDLICKGRVVEDPQEDEVARGAVLEKYAPRSGDDLEEWGRTAMPIAIDLPPG